MIISKVSRTIFCRLGQLLKSQIYTVTNSKCFCTASFLQNTTQIDFKSLESFCPGEKNTQKINLTLEALTVALKRNKCPEFLNRDQLSELVLLETKNQRLEYLFYLFKKEILKTIDAEKKRIKRENRLLEKEEGKDEEYPCERNNFLLLCYRKKRLNEFYKKRLANAVLFGSKVVLDLGYENHMTMKEKHSGLAQLRELYSANRRSPNPFDMYFCNADPESVTVKGIQKSLPNIEDFFVSITDKSYTDLFPRENLVYLSPHAKDTLKCFDHSAVYIIGAFVDTIKKEKVSLHRAERDRIKSYSLPLDEHIMWGLGTKSLTINQAFEIMLVLKNTGDWVKALACVPQRKIKRLDEHMENETNKIYLLNTMKN